MQHYATACLTFALLVLAPWTVVAQDRVRTVQPAKDWKGYFADNNDRALMKEAPGDGRVITPEAFAKLWKAWMGKEELPIVDFKKELVFAYAAHGPNMIVMNFRLEDGNLTKTFSATEKGGPGFCFRIVTVPREGIKTIDGKALGD